MIVNYWPVLNPARNEHLNERLDYECKSFLAEFKEKGWRSLTVNNYHTHDLLEKRYKPRTALGYETLCEKFNYRTW